MKPEKKNYPMNNPSVHEYVAIWNNCCDMWEKHLKHLPTEDEIRGMMEDYLYNNKYEDYKHLAKAIARRIWGYGDEE